MTFVGSDGSCINVNVDDKLPNGKISFNDIAFDSTITIYENLWICGLKSSGVEAVDVYLLYTHDGYNTDNLNAYWQLQSEIEHCQAVRENINTLTNSVMKGHKFPINVLRQLKALLLALENKVTAKRKSIVREVAVF